ncbi:MAG: hypothetical protein ACREIT_11135, partial [Tepidisphaeraceae bacterium]
GGAAITRPADAVCFALPVALAVLIRLRGVGWRRGLVIVGIGVLGSAPFLSLQLAFNKGVTGHWSYAPAYLWNQQKWPGVALFGSRLTSEQAARLPPPTTSLPQLRLFYRDFIVPPLVEHARQGWGRRVATRARLLLRFGLPDGLLVVLALLGAGAAWRRPVRWVMLAPPLLFLGIYAFMPYLVLHYNAIAAPGLAFASVLGIAAIGAACPARLRRRGVTPALALACTLLCLSALPELNRSMRDDAGHLPGVTAAEVLIPPMVGDHAVVLFRFGPRSSIHDEPVFNSQVAWPDDARVVRAHDLGPRNVEIFRYYARIQPERTFWLFDRGNFSLTYLGKASELGKIDQWPATSATTQP